MGTVMLCLGLKNRCEVGCKSCCGDSKHIAEVTVNYLGSQSALVQRHYRKCLLTYVCGAKQTEYFIAVAPHQWKSGLFQAPVELWQWKLEITSHSAGKCASMHSLICLSKRRSLMENDLMCTYI